MITEYANFCLLCGTPRTDIHHLVFGVAKRKLADQDGLTMPLCDSCHRAIHQGKMQTLSKIIGQLAWEKDYLIKEGNFPFKDPNKMARESFRKRYSESFL